ncbi:hypothetical protein OIO90_002007 [Microbotryomycetes sp. JL221]|nr:hypothetical protein OIO90_002007 [Microbotryomycetes sp. JL221]
MDYDERMERRRQREERESNLALSDALRNAQGNYDVYFKMTTNTITTPAPLPVPSDDENDDNNNDDDDHDDDNGQAEQRPRAYIECEAEEGHRRSNSERPHRIHSMTNSMTRPQTHARQDEYLVLELEGLYDDTTLEDEIFAQPRPDGSTARVKLVRAGLGPKGEGLHKPLSELDDDLCRKVDGLMVFRHYITVQDLHRFPKLKALVRSGVGYDRLDRAALAARNIVVSNVPAYGTNEVADHTLALILSLRRGIVMHHERQRASPPASWSSIDTPLVRRLQADTLGLVGLGRIGTAVALRAKAFGFKILFYDPFLPEGIDKALQIDRVRTLDALFDQSSVVSIHCPNTKATRRLITTDLINRLQQGSVLVNTARGEIVDTDAVYEGLASGKLAGAGLDVLEIEPPSEPHIPKLMKAYRAKESWLEGRLILTPHSAFYSPESFQDIRRMSAETLKSTLIDDVPMNVIDPEME